MRLVKFCFFVACMVGVMPPSFASELEGRFCVVPVKDGSPTEADVNATWRMTNTKFQIPGFPTPIYTPMNRKGTWAIGKDRAFKSFVGLSPNGFLDNWKQEPWSGRVVLVRYRGGDEQIIAFEQGDKAFKVIEGGNKFRSFSGPDLLPSRKETIVYSKGFPYVVEQENIRPWKAKAELSAAGIGGVKHIYDTPSLGGVIVISSKNIFYLFANNNWNELGSLGEKDTPSKVVDLPNVSSALFFANKSVYLINKKDDVIKTQLVNESTDGAGSSYIYSKQFDQSIRYSYIKEKKQYGWQKLGNNGFEYIQGSPTNSTMKEHVYGAFREATTIGLAIIIEDSSLYAYDGSVFKFLPNSSAETLGKYISIHDLRSIGRTLVSGYQKELFEITKDGTIKPLKFSFKTNQGRKPNIVDWVEASVALISTESGLYAVDKNLDSVAVNGGDALSYKFAGNVPVTGDVVLSGRKGLFLAVDKDMGHEQICNFVVQREKLTPTIQLCVKPVPNSGKDILGHAIGGWAEAPNGDGIIVDGVKGLFHLSAENKLNNLRPHGRSVTRYVEKLPWSGEVLAGGNIIVDKDLTLSFLGKDLVSDHVKVLPSKKAFLVFRGKNKKIKAYMHQEDNGYKDVFSNFLGIPDFDKSSFPFVTDLPWNDFILLEKRRHQESYLGVDSNGDVRKKLTTQGFELPPSSEWSKKRTPYDVPEHWLIERFKTVLVRNRYGWTYLGSGMNWLLSHDLPKDVFILETFDSGEGPIYLGTTEGVYVINNNYKIIKLSGKNSTKGIKTFAKVPNSNDILAGGYEGLYIIDSSTKKISPFNDNIYDTVGAVSAIENVEFNKQLLIKASLGTFLVDEAKSIYSVDNVEDLWNIRAFPAIQKIYATKRESSDAMLYEIDSRTDCKELPVTKQ